MVLPVLAAFAKAAAPYVLPAVAGAINQKNQNKAAMDAYNAQRAAEKKDQAIKFTDMAAAARRAGFNPLTVLRATGGAGFGGTNAVMPVMSKQNFAATFVSNAFGQYLTNKQNEPIDAYNKEVRGLELEQRRAEIKIANQTMGAMSKAAARSNIKLEKMPANAVENDDIHTDEVLSRVTKTTDDKSIDNEARAILYPIVVGGRTYHLPFNPDDMDPITMMGQAGLYGALSWHDYIKDNYESQAPWTRNKSTGLINPVLSAYQMRNFKVHKADRETTADWSLR